MQGGQTPSSSVDLREKVRENMSRIRYKVAIMSGKGGVGKTTVTANLAYALAMRKYRVGVLDADIYGPDIPIALSVEDRTPKIEDNMIIPFKGPMGIWIMSMQFLLPEEESPVIWMGPLVAKAIMQFLAQVKWGELDFLLIDLPPGTGDEVLAVVKNIPDLTGIIIVVTPQKIALHDAKKAANMAKIVNVPVLGIIENMSGFRCPHCGKITYIFGRGGGKTTAEKLGIPFLGELPLDPRIVKLTDEGKPFILEDPELTERFNTIVDNLIRSIETLDAKAGSTHSNA